LDDGEKYSPLRDRTSAINLSIVLQIASNGQLAVAVAVSRKKMTGSCYCEVPTFFKHSLEKGADCQESGKPYKTKKPGKPSFLYQ
jgi:hypothetical protein